jgi:hypothetical protein
MEEATVQQNENTVPSVVRVQLSYRVRGKRN